MAKKRSSDYWKRRKQKAKQKKKQQHQDAIDFLTRFSPNDLLEEGKNLQRKFVLHIGPTNSGKTYHALQALKQAETGVYLGPLRLLALEVAENLNFDGIPCNLITGEECIEVPFAYKTASTIELCDYNEHYDVAVIDEAQMLSDPDRGAKWLKAITSVDAEEVHICLAPEAEKIIISLIETMQASYEIQRTERLVPLVFSGFFDDITQVQPGDALIAFSRKKVLQISALLEKKGIKASVIYGALPPASRREEVRRFSEKETAVVVATDAIGMGISLPIRRIIFMDVEKFDGKETRDLRPEEIKQIAGRAGRFGKYDLGEVLTMYDPDLIEQGMKAEVPQIEKVTISFPKEAAEYDKPLMDMLTLWDNLPKDPLFERENMAEARILLKSLPEIPEGVDKTLIYDVITCPVDVKNPKLVQYWAICAESVFENSTLPKPQFREDNLENCELKYHAYDIYHQMLRRIEIEDSCQEKKLKLSEKINDYLKKEKKGFLRRCRRCGREMSLTDRYSICEKCYAQKMRPLSE